MQQFFRRKKMIRYFTLMELLVSMAVFSILSLLLMRIFGATQNVWQKTSQKAEVQETGRMVMDRIETDIRSAYAPPGVCTIGTSPNVRSYHFLAADSSFPKSWVFYAGKAENPTGKPNWATNLVLVKYSLKQIGSGTNSDDLCCLLTETFYSYVASGTNYFNSFFTSGTVPTDTAPELLADNVISFEIQRFTTASTGYSQTNSPAFPYWVIVKLKLLDPDWAERYIGAATGTARTDIADEHSTLFTRVIPLNNN